MVVVPVLADQWTEVRLPAQAMVDAIVVTVPEGYRLTDLEGYSG